MGLKVRDDAGTMLTLYKVVGEYVDGTIRHGDARDFAPGEQVPQEYSAIVQENFDNPGTPEYEHLHRFLEESDAAPDVGDDYDSQPVGDLKDEAAQRGLEVQGSGSGGRVTKSDLAEALRANDASGVPADNPFVT